MSEKKQKQGDVSWWLLILLWLASIPASIIDWFRGSKKPAAVEQRWRVGDTVSFPCPDRRGYWLAGTIEKIAFMPAETANVKVPGDRNYMVPVADLRGSDRYGGIPGPPPSPPPDPLPPPPPPDQQ